MENNSSISKNRGFKRKTIEEIIHRKIMFWVKSIEDESLRKEVMKNYIVTGGAITSMLLGDLPNDYDVYFKDVSVAKKVAEYYLKKLPESYNSMVSESKVIETKNEDGSGRVEIFIKSAGIAGEGSDQSDYQYFEMTDGSGIHSYIDNITSVENGNGKYKVVYMTTNAITLTDGIQIIIRFCGMPEQIHKNYDFVHTTNWFTNGQLFLNLPAVESTMAKELKYVGSLYPICSMFRIKKFIKRGWTITAGEMLKIAWDISKLNLNDPKTLEDQLVGVDAAYFNQVITILKKENNTSLDRTYLFELVNRVFDEYDADEAQEKMMSKNNSN
jgi:hypothetical protein